MTVLQCLIGCAFFGIARFDLFCRSASNHLMTIDLTRDEILAPESIAAAERENSMRTFMRSAKRSLAAAVAALAAIFLTGARAAESLQIEGGQIADAAPDASGIRVFKGIPYAAPPVGSCAGRRLNPCNHGTAFAALLNGVRVASRAADSAILTPPRLVFAE